MASENYLPDSKVNYQPQDNQRISITDSLKGINEIAFISFVLYNMGSDFFSPQDVVSKLKNQDLSVSEVKECLRYATLHGLLSVSSPDDDCKFKCKFHLTTNGEIMTVTS